MKALLTAACVMPALAATAAPLVISVPSDPAPTVAFAAEELSHYVGRITGEAPTVSTNAAPTRGVRIAIDPAEDDDSFTLKAADGLYSVIGGRRGVLYGVYETLERFGGVDWLASWRTVVPKGDFALPASLDERQSPAYVLREQLTSDATTNVPFAVHLRMNGLRSHNSTKPFPVDPKYGGRAWREVNGLKSCHTFTYLMPLAKYYKEHPEYYALVDGVRRDMQWQLCLTNPDVLRIVTARVLELLDADPEASMVSVSHNDNQRNYCRCERCAAVDAYEESHAGTELRFVNAVADAVKKRHPGVFVQMPAYQYTRKAPKHTKPRDNVIITVCSIECDRLKPFGTRPCTEVNMAFERDLAEWGRVTKMMRVSEYTGENLHYFYPMPTVVSAYENFRYLHENGVRMAFVDGNGHRAMHAEFCEMKCWLVAKALWNPYRPLDPLVDRFIKGYYGKAAPFVRAYYDKAKAQAAKMPADMVLTIYQTDSKTRYPDAYLAESLELWDKAEAAVADDPETLYNVRMGKASVMRLILDRMCANAKWVWATRHPERFPAPDPRAAAYERFLLDRETDAKAHGRQVRFGNTPQRDRRPRALWRRYVTMAPPAKASDSALVGVDAMQISEVKFGQVVSLSDAIGGMAVEINNRYEEEAPFIDFRNVAYDRDAQYLVRVRLKVKPLPGGGKGQAVRVNCGDQEISIDAKDAPTDWKWYEFAPFRPKDSDRISVRPGHRVVDSGGRMAFDKIYVDAFEIAKLRGDRDSVEAADCGVFH